VLCANYLNDKTFAHLLICIFADQFFTMKKITFLSILILSLAACSGKKKEANELKKQVLDLHEQVMGDDDKAMHNKMKLDTLIKQAAAQKADTTGLQGLRSNLVSADNGMMDWMSKLKVDYTNDDPEMVVKYWQYQQKVIKQVDAMLVTATVESSAYLDKQKK